MDWSTPGLKPGSHRPRNSTYRPLTNSLANIFQLNQWSSITTNTPIILTVRTGFTFTVVFLKLPAILAYVSLVKAFRCRLSLVESDDLSSRPSLQSSQYLHVVTKAIRDIVLVVIVLVIAIQFWLERNA